MTLFASRCLPLIILSLLLPGCQSSRPSQPYQAPMDSTVVAFQALEEALIAGRLDDAQSRLASLRQSRPSDTRVEQYQRQLVEAYLLQGQQALRSGDLDNATQALRSARQLMPQAPALTAGLDTAISQSRAAQQADAAKAAQAAAARAESAAREAAQQLAAQRLQREEERRQAAAPEPTPPAPQARLIDPAALVSTVPLPMLDVSDDDALRSVLDRAAHDVVTFDCSVRVEVREAKDFPWVAALLSARVKKLDPGYRLRISQHLVVDQAPQLTLRPRR